jgi:hypothetical protein
MLITTQLSYMRFTFITHDMPNFPRNGLGIPVHRASSG